MEMETFKLMPSETKVSMRQKGYQMLPLRCIFDSKQDGRCKARIVIGGHLVDSSGYDTYVGNMKSISARLLMLITTANNLQVITIGNAYLYAKSDLKTDVALSPLPAAYRDFTVAYYLWPTGSMLCSLIS
jgi:hypothetical protein